MCLSHDLSLGSIHGAGPGSVQPAARRNGSGAPDSKSSPRSLFCLFLGEQRVAVAEVLCRDAGLLNMVPSGYFVVEFEAAR